MRNIVEEEMFDQELYNAYLEVSQDLEREEEIKEWDVLTIEAWPNA